MNTHIILALSCVFLSGCAVVQQAQLNSGMKQAEIEMANCGPASLPSKVAQALEKVRMDDLKLCPASTEEVPLPPSKAIEKYDCQTNLVNKYVRPVSKNKKELDVFLSEGKSIATAYKSEKLNREEANLQAEMAYLNYIQHEVSYYRLSQCRNVALSKNVMPSYPHKGLLSSFMTKQLEIGLKVDEGKLSRDQADIEISKAFSSLLEAEQYANAAIQQQNSRAWQQSFENLQRIEENNKRNMPVSTIKHTNCSKFGNTMNCTSW